MQTGKRRGKAVGTVGEPGDGSQSLAPARNSEQKNRAYEASAVGQSGGKVGSGSFAAVEVEGVHSLELLVMAVVAALAAAEAGRLQPGAAGPA